MWVSKFETKLTEPRYIQKDKKNKTINRNVKKCFDKK
jgi:hypothetical protein